LNVGIWPTGVSGMLDIPWFRKVGYGVWTEVTRVKGVQRAKHKKYHMTLRYTQMNMRRKVSSFYWTCG
jgi:hypothetical protein